MRSCHPGGSAAGVARAACIAGSCLCLTWNLNDLMPNILVSRYQMAGQLQNLHTEGEGCQQAVHI